MELSLIDEQILNGLDDESFLLSNKPEEMDDEVSNILKKWSLTNPAPKIQVDSIDPNNHPDSFDPRTFTRKKRIFPNDDVSSIESGISSINLQVGGTTNNFYPKSMQKSWLNDVSPPTSICTSMDFQNVDNMLNSLITSGDFSDVSFLQGGNETFQAVQKVNGTITIDNKTPTNRTHNLMDFTFDVNRPKLVSDATFTADAESPFKEYSIENADITLSESLENLGKNLTFDARKNGNDLTWEKISNHHNQTIVQSTPVHVPDQMGSLKAFDHTMSPISSIRNEEEEVVIRNLKARNLVNDITMENYRTSMEDQCEFLLNEETIKLTSRFCGDSVESLDIKSALIQSADANERDFDKMLDSFNVTKSLKSEKLLQSVDNIKQRHSLINFEKQREEKQKKDEEYDDNKSQYETMNKSSERLLRRSRLYDDVNLQLQKQQNETMTFTSAKPEASAEDLEDEVVDKNNRDRFKTIKLNKKLQSGMVVVNDEPAEVNSNEENTSPGSNKEKRNQINQQKQENEDTEFKKPAPSKMSKFGFSRPTYRSRNELNLPLKASSTDNLDEPRIHTNGVPNVKSPMGIKSKSIHNLMFNGTSQQAMRMGSYGNLRLNAGATKSQSNLKASRPSSLVRPLQEQGYKAPVSTIINQQPAQMRVQTRKPLVRPSSGYLGNTFSAKRFDSDESGCSLSSSSASSRNSVHLSNPVVDHQSTEMLDQVPKKAIPTGAIPKPAARPSGLRAPQARSGLPRPSSIIRR